MSMDNESDCDVCGRRDFYMVVDSVWQEAGFAKEIICRDCLEEKLGRKLYPTDFEYVLGAGKTNKEGTC